MLIMNICSLAVSFWWLVESGNAFSLTTPHQHAHQSHPKLSVTPYSSFRPRPSSSSTLVVELRASESSEQEEDAEEKKDEINPYADPNYPELEFVNYDDPEYRVDQGVGDEFSDPTSTEEQIEAMREERRVKNDEYQFETYYRDILKEGQEYKGEWLVYQSVQDDPVVGGGLPRLAIMSGEPLKVISRGERIEINSSSSSTAAAAAAAALENNRLEHTRLVHHEMIYTDMDEKKSPEQVQAETEIMNSKYTPLEISSRDFRGEQGIMCVGNAYTICSAVPLNEGQYQQAGETTHAGPFSQYRSELGIQSNLLRFRIKLDYAVRANEQETQDLPPLHLKSLIVCRETLGMWPRNEKYKSKAEAMTGEALFGPPGASGGLYDPPPVGSEEQASQYMKLDLEGGATLLFPYLMDQNPDVYPNSGWVTSLDWTPAGPYRYQVDRKVNGGKGILGLRTLELSEVASSNAADWRPKDGGADMRQ
jgi:hypothetical protein